MNIYILLKKSTSTQGFCHIPCQEFHWILIFFPKYPFHPARVSFLLSKYTVFKGENLSLWKKIIYTIHCINDCVIYLTYISECFLLLFFNFHWLKTSQCYFFLEWLLLTFCSVFNTLCIHIQIDTICVHVQCTCSSVDQT